MKKIIIFTMMSLVFSVLESCGSGVKDRSISTSTLTNNTSTLTLTSSEIQSLAESKISTELEALGIEDYYADAKLKFPMNNFVKLSDFLLINCLDAKSSSAVSNFNAYGKLLHDANSEDHVMALIDDIALLFNSEQQTALSANQLAIVLKAMEKISQYRIDVMAKAIKCRSVKVTIINEEGEIAPIDPPRE